MLKLTSVLGNSQRLDGGAMFGNAPRPLWSRWASPDERGRIELVCRAFLIEDGRQRVLLEAGIGAFFEPELRERYGVLEAEHVLLDSLAKLGLDEADIDVLVLSHLHFDHAGGLLAAHEPGAPARLLFPRARFIVGKTAFERAQKPHARDRASFIPELPALLERSGRLRLVESPGELAGELGDAFDFLLTSGHTPGMLHTRIRGQHGSAVFAADLVPGTPWVNLPITMGYDRFPEQLIDEKLALFRDVQATGGHLLYTHDPKVAASQLEVDARGRWLPRAASAELRAWDLDATPAPN
jgi:glyoxylase-like metal-dependent hydrolase (beta-lactamase superfamily II)